MNILNHYQNSYRRELLEKIESLDSEVFQRGDLSENKSNKEQLRLNRALKTFIDQGHIIKISHGLYAKAMKISINEASHRIVLRVPFESVAVEALNKLGIKWEFGQAIQEYNRGDTTQIPTKFTVRLKSRFRGLIQAEGRKIEFEGGIHAR